MRVEKKNDIEASSEQADNPNSDPPRRPRQYARNQEKLRGQ
jgi:hypothetical protein